MKRINTLVVLSLFTLVLFGCAYKQSLMMTPSIRVPQNANMEKTSKIIHNVLARRTWNIVEEGNGFINAKIARGQTAAEVKITYDNKHVEIKRVSSSPNLRYNAKNGEERIHNHYNTWVRNLERDINSELAKQ